MTADTRLHPDAASAAAAICGDPAMAERVRAHAAACRLVTMLTDMRLERDLTQTEVARRMGVTASKISKLESSDDASLRIRDIDAYVRALGMQTCISFTDPSLPAADAIKAAVFEIHDRLNHLADLARSVGEDRDITDKINQFYGEVLFNFLMKFRDSHKRLCTALKLDEYAAAKEPQPSEPAKREAPRAAAVAVT